MQISIFNLNPMVNLIDDHGRRVSASATEDKSMIAELRHRFKEGILTSDQIRVEKADKSGSPQLALMLRVSGEFKPAMWVKGLNGKVEESFIAKIVKRIKRTSAKNLEKLHKELTKIYNTNAGHNKSAGKYGFSFFSVAQNKLVLDSFKAVKQS